MPNKVYYRVLTGFVSIRTMAAPALAAIASFKVVLCSEYPVAPGRPIKISFFDLRYVFHALMYPFYTKIRQRR